MDRRLLLLHLLYWAPYLPRLVGRLRHPPPPGGPRAARGRLLVLLHFAAGGVLYGGLLLTPTSPPGSVRLAGAAAAILGGGALATWTLVTFRSWRIAPILAPDHELCTRGPFARLRHPIYLSNVLLALGSWLYHPGAATLGALLLFLLAGDLRGRAEERLLEATYQERWRRYRDHTWRLLPPLY